MKTSEPVITGFDRQLHSQRAARAATRLDCETKSCLLEQFHPGTLAGVPDGHCYYHRKIAANLLAPFGGMVNRKGS